jgi:hypothetical protein
MVIESLTAILVVITGVYAYLTHRIAKATESSVAAINRQSEASLRPYITVAPFVRPKALFLYLRIANNGHTAAENLRLTLDRDFFQWGKREHPERNLRTQSAFTLPIDNFAPGAELLFGLGQGWVLFGADADPASTPLQFNVVATYEFFGKKVEETTHVDLRPYPGSEGEVDPLIEELERIRKELEKLPPALVRGA